MQMNKLYLFLIFIVAISGCNKFNQATSTTTCSDSDGIRTAKSLITDEIIKELSDVKGQDGSRLFDQSEIRATIAQIDIAFDSIRTSKTDPNSTKVFCTASVKATIPLLIIEKANRGFQITETRRNVDDSANEYGLRGTANGFSRDLDYNLQPTDDRQQIYTQLTNGEPIINFLSEVAAAVLIVPMLEAKEAEDANAASIVDAQNAANQLQLEQQKSEALQLSLTAAQEENTIAKNALYKAWASIPPSRRAELIDSQNEWEKRIKIDCQSEVIQQVKDDISLIPLFELQCETIKITDRTVELGSNQPQATE
jgi:hypothetical protein